MKPKQATDSFDRRSKEAETRKKKKKRAEYRVDENSKKSKACVEGRNQYSQSSKKGNR
jgi:hypothetical protein